MLLAARIVCGMAAGGIFPVGMALIGDLVPVEQRQVVDRPLAGDRDRRQRARRRPRRRGRRPVRLARGLPRGAAVGIAALPTASSTCGTPPTRSPARIDFAADPGQLRGNLRQPARQVLLPRRVPGGRGAVRTVPVRRAAAVGGRRGTLLDRRCGARRILDRRHPLFARGAADDAHMAAVADDDRRRHRCARWR